MSQCGAPGRGASPALLEELQQCTGVPAAPAHVAPAPDGPCWCPRPPAGEHTVALMSAEADHPFVFFCVFGDLLWRSAHLVSCLLPELRVRSGYGSSVGHVGPRDFSRSPWGPRGADPPSCRGGPSPALRVEDDPCSWVGEASSMLRVVGPPLRHQVIPKQCVSICSAVQLMSPGNARGRAPQQSGVQRPRSHHHAAGCPREAGPVPVPGQPLVPPGAPTCLHPLRGLLGAWVISGHRSVPWGAEPVLGTRQADRSPPAVLHGQGG